MKTYALPQTVRSSAVDMRAGAAAIPATHQVAPLPEVSLAQRRAACGPCAWNVDDRCEHPAQGCAPCRQGIGLQRAMAQPWFHCPLKYF